jgi:uncharacterized lipoprotein YddW (UPF0748 family)
MRYTVQIILTIIITATMAACKGTEIVKVAPDTQKNILWFDATANFKRFSTKDSITYYLEKSKWAGVTDVVIDIKPISGEVLYPSKIAPIMTEWIGEYQSGGKTDMAWDMLSYFIEEGHRLGLIVHASINVFVAGHNYFDRGVVYTDPEKAHWQTISFLPEGMVPITEQKKKYSAMLNPALRDVQEYQLAIIKEIVSMYPKLGGLILDRVRYDNIEADFSEVSKEMFEAYIGKKVENFPQDIFYYENSARKDGPLFKQWLEWRAKIIHDFFVEARKEVKKINPNIIYGDYVGSWYPSYYSVGVNWASKKYDPSQDFAWATEKYKDFGYSEQLDLFTVGSYYFEVEKRETSNVDQSTLVRTEAGQTNEVIDWYTVEGSAEMAKKLVHGDVPVYAGLYVEQYKNHPEQFIKALKMCRAKSDGAMVFDIVHIVQYNWWEELKKGLTE